MIYFLTLFLKISGNKDELFQPDSSLSSPRTGPVRDFFVIPSPILVGSQFLGNIILMIQSFSKFFILSLVLLFQCFPKDKPRESSILFKVGSDCDLWDSCFPVI